jgi:negative regulator of sigma E activity
MPAEAQAPSYGGGPIGGVTTGDIVGAVAAAAAVVVVAVFLTVHYSKKRTITGCVNSGPNGTTVTDEKDNQIYALSSNTAGIKPGDRMKLHGKRVKSKGPDKKLVWETKSVAKDYGVCQP